MIFEEFHLKYSRDNAEAENLYWFLIFETFIREYKAVLPFPQLDFEIATKMDRNVEDKFEVVSLRFLDGQSLEVRLPRVSIEVRASNATSSKKVFVSDGTDHTLLTSRLDPLNEWIFLLEHNCLNNINRYKKLLAEDN